MIDESDPDNQQSRVEHNAGNVKSSTTITFEFAKRKNSKCESSLYGFITQFSYLKKSPNIFLEYSSLQAYKLNVIPRFKVISP